jgi:hypothetical protein
MHDLAIALWSDSDGDAGALVYMSMAADAMERALQAMLTFHADERAAEGRLEDYARGHGRAGIAGDL